MNKLLPVMCLTPLLITAFNVSAQDNETIVAERPGFSSSPIALAPTRFQVESGYQYTNVGGTPDVEDQTLPLLLLRYGLADRLELQFGWAGRSRTEVGGSTFSGANDASLGLKWQVTDPGANVPLALFAGLTLPTGNSAYSSKESDLTVGAFWSHSAKLDWFGTVLISESGNDTSLSNAVGISLPIDDSTGAYVEYFGNYGGNGGPGHNINGGITYLPRNNLQLDVHLGLGLNDRTADSFMGLGLAYLF